MQFCAREWQIERRLIVNTALNVHVCVNVTMLATLNTAAPRSACAVMLLQIDCISSSARLYVRAEQVSAATHARASSTPLLSLDNALLTSMLSHLSYLYPLNIQDSVIFIIFVYAL
jgi:hypothetical protein